MKNTGMVRNLDDLGRITLPIELRRNLNLGVNEPVEIYTEGTALSSRSMRQRPLQRS